MENGKGFKICIYYIGLQCKNLEKVPRDGNKVIHFCDQIGQQDKCDKADLVSNLAEAEKRQAELGIH